MPTHALLLTAPPGQGALTAALAERALRQVPASARGSTRWLAPGEAWQVLLASEGLPPADILAAVSDELSGHPIDVNMVAAAPGRRRKRLLVADMESTIIEQEMLDELAAFAGLREPVAAITGRAMRGEIAFEAALAERLLLLAGLDAGVLEAAAARMTPVAGAAVLVRTMQAHGAYCALVSGGFTAFTEPIARRLGFDEHQANTIEVRSGRLTGRVVGPALGRAAKFAALQRLAARLGLAHEETLAVGDGANDLDMLGAAGLGVAFRAKPPVRAAVRATATGAVIDHGDLTALLYAQGYARAEFAPCEG